MLCYISFLLAAVTCFWGSFCRQESVIFEVYRTKGATWPVKFLFIFIFLTLRKIWRSSVLPDARDEMKNQKICYMEQPQKLDSHPLAIDAVAFNGASKDGWNIMVAIARRPKRVMNGFLMFRIPGIGILTGPKAPNTTLKQCITEKGFTAEGISFTCVVPMVAWKFNYEGLLRVEQPSEDSPYKIGTLINAKVSGLWTSNLPYFDFDEDMSPQAVASAMARHPWNREYFEMLGRGHQTHHEQFGVFEGTVSLDETEHKFEISCMRDHSFGRKRDWKDFHRYILHYFTSDDGLRFSLGVICMPNLFSRLVIGYVYSKEGKLTAVDSTTLFLHELGEGGTTPVDYAFTMTAGGINYDVQIMVEESSQVFMTEKWDARVVESFAKARINGVNAWGTVEFEYRNIKPKKNHRAPVTLNNNRA